MGQRFVQLLADHPWFEIGALTASDRSVGKRYGDAAKWLLRGGMPARVADMVLVPTEPGAIARRDVRLLFSALPGGTAGPVEEELAAAGFAVCSNASAHRMDPDVPLLIPDVNPEHTALIPQQRSGRWQARLAARASSSPTRTAPPPTWSARSSRCTTPSAWPRSTWSRMQAISGAGYPGVSSLDILDNVIPYIGGEEEKIEIEPRKLLGRLAGDGIAARRLPRQRAGNRVAVRNGHLEAVTVKLNAHGDASRRSPQRFTGYAASRSAWGCPPRPTRPSSCTPSRTGRSRGSTGWRATAWPRASAACAPIRSSTTSSSSWATTRSAAQPAARC